MKISEDLDRPRRIHSLRRAVRIRRYKHVAYYGFHSAHLLYGIHLVLFVLNILLMMRSRDFNPVQLSLFPRPIYCMPNFITTTLLLAGNTFVSGHHRVKWLYCCSLPRLPGFHPVLQRQRTTTILQ